jgi:general nucleoside transport system ATP-binding protein
VGGLERDPAYNLSSGFTEFHKISQNFTSCLFDNATGDSLGLNQHRASKKVCEVILLGKVLLELKNITKRFPGVVANNQVNLTLFEGEIHALLGENGAGKTTLISMLYGLLRPDEGQILMEGQPVGLRSPSQAIALGIGLVPQHPLLVAKHTALENLALGLKTGMLLELNTLRQRFLEISQRYGLAVSPDVPVWQLSAGEKQRLELLRALARGSRILILDEPTAALAPLEVEQLFKVLAQLRQEGLAVVMISHKLEEVLSICDRVTVLRKGQVVASQAIAGLVKSDLSRMMVGREVAFERAKTTQKAGQVLLEVHNICAQSDQGLEALKNLSFSLHQGEILGIAGVSGNGQLELGEVLAGLRTSKSGDIHFLGQSILKQNPDQRFKKGMAHIPEDRIGQGIVSELSVLDNLALRGYAHAPLGGAMGGAFLNPKAMLSFALERISSFDIATPSPHTRARTLSGGNIQKIILARELSGDPKLILAIHPTHGLDVGATEGVHQTLLEARTRGVGILLISEDLDEILLLSDRVAVMHGGEIKGTFITETANRNQIGALMAGSNL